MILAVKRSSLPGRAASFERTLKNRVHPRRVCPMLSALLKFSREHPDFPVIDFLNQSAFDELITVNLTEDRYQYIFNVDRKYWTPSLEGTYSTFFDHISQHVIHPEDRAVYREMLDPEALPRRLSETGGLFSFAFRAPLQSGGWCWCEQYVVGGGRQNTPDDLIYFYIYDVQSRKDREAGRSLVPGPKMLPDALTGLPREKDFYSLGESLLAGAQKDWLLIAIDLQHFKLFNEWYGRELGDHVLSDIGHSLLQVAQNHGGIAGYMGGDDFSLLVPYGSLQPETLFDAIQGIIADHGVSVGFLPALGACRSRGNSIYQLYDEATLACQEAKKNYKSRVVFFSASLVEQTVEDYKTLSDFKNALAAGEITFYLQPQCRAVNGNIVGAEALARWLRPDGTCVSPVSFVPTLEKYGFIPDLDRHIWEEVCRWIRSSLDRGNPLIPISVNISPVDIFTLNVPRYFSELIRKYDLPQSAVKVEITESAYGEDSDKVRATVQELRDAGFAVLMDDFGSGYSSLNMLRELNVDMIKLDAYFLRMQEDTEKKGMHIIESVVNMAKTMSMPIIVEGVETNEHRAYLMSLGCRYIQGYYFYKPMPARDFEALIADGSKVDRQGFTFKFNEEFHIREFLNDEVYTDSMLNHIIGPAAIYAWHGDGVDIVRFNQEFYQAVNVSDFTSRLLNIQQYMPEKEAPLLLKALEQAFEDRLNGSSATLSFRKSDGSMAKFLIHFYFLGGGQTKRFYGSARDITGIANLQRQMNLLSRFVSRTVIFLSVSGDDYSFEVVAHGLEKAMGLSRQEMEEELNNARFYKRLIPRSKSFLWKVAFQCIETKGSASQPLRMEGADGAVLCLVLDADYVEDPLSDVKCILSLRQEKTDAGRSV